MYLYKSDKPAKKYYIEYTTNEGNTKKIYFGAIRPNGIPYEAFIDHKNEDRKNRYIKRHQSRENWNELSPGMLSRFLLWNKPSLTASIKDTNERFNIKIINKTKQNNKTKVLNEKPSAYRSMKLSRLGLSKPTTQANKGKLQTWRDEMWENLTARITDGDKFYNCGTKGKKQGNLPSVCRPSKRINKSTPQPLSNELSNVQIKKAIKIKQRNQRINWKDL